MTIRMAVFFFVVGLEIKREIAVGELSTGKKAALPVSANTSCRPSTRPRLAAQDSTPAMVPRSGFSP